MPGGNDQPDEAPDNGPLSGTTAQRGLREQPVPASGTCATHARYPVHHLTEAGMARTITIVFDEDLGP